jgi:hypothetical protein
MRSDSGGLADQGIPARLSPGKAARLGCLPAAVRSQGQLTRAWLRYGVKAVCVIVHSVHSVHHVGKYTRGACVPSSRRQSCQQPTPYVWGVGDREAPPLSKARRGIPALRTGWEGTGLALVREARYLLVSQYNTAWPSTRRAVDTAVSTSLLQSYSRALPGGFGGTVTPFLVYPVVVPLREGDDLFRSPHEIDRTGDTRVTASMRVTSQTVVLGPPRRACRCRGSVR